MHHSRSTNASQASLLMKPIHTKRSLDGFCPRSEHRSLQSFKLWDSMLPWCANRLSSSASCPNVQPSCSTSSKCRSICFLYAPSSPLRFLCLSTGRCGLSLLSLSLPFYHTAHRTTLVLLTEARTTTTPTGQSSERERNLVPLLRLQETG